MPNSVLTRRRSFVARITALAMVASLMVIGAAPASAAVDTSDSCPSTTPSAGFTDIGGLDATTQLAINCLVSYGISNGTSATTYSPNGEVTRWQMALFLTRQASTHGVTLPSGAPQGFNDIQDLPASYQVAINQLSQLEITQGTSATTFSPHDPVTRWQMALFLTRLLTAAGVTLPSGAPQGFNDLGGLSNEAQLAINQLAQLDIADGTSATTFNPFANVNRWQMALFLTRTLAVDGITPTQALVSIAPDTALTVNAGQSRTFTATFLNPNGSPYVGAVAISVRKTTAGNPVATTTNISATTDSLAGLGTPTISGFPGANGQVTFTVTNVTAENVVVRAWQDQGVANQTWDATEPMDLTDVTTFSSVAAAAAITGSYVVTVSSTMKANNTFVGVPAVNCGNGALAPCTFTYDDGDIFTVDGGAAFLAGFEGALSQGDTITINTYQATAANQSNFALVDAVATLTVTSPAPVPAAAPTVDAAQYTIAGQADPDVTVNVYNDADLDGVIDAPADGIVGTAVASSDGSYSIPVNLTQNAVNRFIVRQVVGLVDNRVATQLITESVAAGVTITSSSYTNGLGSAGVLDFGDTIVINFSGNVIGFGSGDTISIIDNDGTTAVLTVGVGGNVTSASPATTNSITLVVSGAIPGTGGGIAGIQNTVTITAVGGFTSANGVAVNVAGSAGKSFLVG